MNRELMLQGLDEAIRMAEKGWSEGGIPIGSVLFIVAQLLSLPDALAGPSDNDELPPVPSDEADAGRAVD